MNEVIKKVDGKWVLFHKNGKGRLGTHDTKDQAIGQEIAIKLSQQRRKTRAEKLLPRIEDEDAWAGWGDAGSFP